MKFEYEVVEHWPPLVWIAQCESGRVRVRHGASVEAHDEWFGEIAWDGPFSNVDFDLTDIVAGSGGRLRGQEAIFVSPGSTNDRLQYLETAQGPLLSNSLACLLAEAELDVDPCHAGYFEDFRSITRGLGAFKGELTTSGGPIRLVYFDNLGWDGKALGRRSKLHGQRDFRDFGTYREFLRRAVRAITVNAADPSRLRPFSPLTTLSAGYDSSTVAVLANEAGATEALTFHPARGGLDDRGAAVAATLGLKVHEVDSRAWKQRPLAEVPFLLANAGGQNVLFAGAEEILDGRLLFSGFHGDTAWGKHGGDLGPNFVRDGFGGLSLTEYRLWAGFLSAPLAFWGGRQLAQLHAISNSAEMQPWDLAGEYSRPICRRIVEEVGVPRDGFGVGKQMAAVLMWDLSRTSMLSDASFADYCAWLSAKAPEWLRRGRIPPLYQAPLDNGIDAIRRRLKTAGGPVARVARSLPVVGSGAGRRKGALFRHLFPWAVEHAKARFHGKRDGALPRSAAGV